jgi:hypothetical protein
VCFGRVKKLVRDEDSELGMYVGEDERDSGLMNRRVAFEGGEDAVAFGDMSPLG